MTAKLTLSEVDSQLELHSLKRIGEYKDTDHPIQCIDVEGYVVNVRLGGLRVGKIPERFYSGNPNSINNISRWIRLKDKPFVLIEGQEYKNSKTKLNLICKKCGEMFDIRWDNLKTGYGCPYCINHKVSSDTCFAAIRPDLIKYFKDQKVAENIAPKSNKNVNLICPDCGKMRTMKAYDLFKYSFACKFCSDGISVPEKFIINLFESIDINFKPQYSPEWILNKRYDFYVPTCNLIIEVHGEQHYNEKLIFKGGGMSLKEQQVNDEQKETLAKNNGYEYVIIDCRKSSFEWLKDNAIKQLSVYFDFSNVNWEDVYKKSRSSLCVEAWKLWDEGLRSPLAISKKIKISRETVTRYLRHGAEAKKVDYDPDKQRRKGCSEESKKKRRKPINQYSLSGEFIKRWDSAQDIDKQLGISFSSVSQCACGITKTAKGFIWKFADV